MPLDSLSTMSSETADSAKVEAAEEHNGPAPDHTRRLLEEEFNIQRAKMKELFLQKEDDMRKMLQEKEQMESEILGLRAECQQLQTLNENQKSEMQSLQLLVSETVEALSSGSEEVRRLRARNLELEQHFSQMRQQQQNIEDNELVRSIIQPLEMEISALKNKLRETDSQLQDTLAKAKSSPGPPGGDARTEGEAGAGAGAGARRGRCDMCANYEKQLVAEQAQADTARDRANGLELALREATAELEGVRSLHDETVRSWHSERTAAADQLARLDALVSGLQQALRERAATAQQAEQRALQAVTELTVERQTLHAKLDSLERDNAMLIGQYTKKAADMQNELIDLPDDVESLQEQMLRLREQLIFCQIGREEAVETERELRTQVLEQGALFHQQEAQLADLRQRLTNTQQELDRLQTEREQMKELGDKLRHSNDMIETLLNDKKRLQGDVQEVRNRVSVLQQELDNSEKVQQDFVRLSQSLQVQLQRIREADTEVRWQHADDVSECPACRTQLPNLKKKVHCRHCGRIFCGACVSHVVESGPRRAPSRVCAVCRTLLQPHAAPYFSTSPPRSPD